MGLPQGRILGGSSAINVLALIPPSKLGINAWENLGNPGWSWEEMLPYYRKFHTLNLPSVSLQDHLGLAYVDEEYRGTSGPIQATFSGALQDPIPKAWYLAFRSLGLDTKTDPFSGQVIGGYNNPVTVDAASKERSYSAVAYYKPASKRSNLRLLTGSIVDEILIERSNSEDDVTAMGVRFSNSEGLQEAHARKETILAAGAFQSPKLLELSGIGSADLLRQHDIDVVVDNPGVGENLQDHLLAGISFEVRDGIKTIDDLARQDPGAVEAAMKSYMTDKTGPLSVGSVGSFAFLPVMKFLAENGTEERKLLWERHSEKLKDIPHYDFTRSLIDSSNEASAAFFMYPGQGNHESGVGAIAKDVIKASLPGNFITIAVCLLHPFSRGSTHIKSNDPTIPPSIDPHYLEKEIDVEILALHLQYIQTLIQAGPLEAILKPNGRRSAPDLDLDNLEAVKEYVRETSISNWHPVGACAMLPRSKGGVLDERMVVHGTKNLRVVDSSSFPIIPRGNPMSTVYAVAEKAADLIKQDKGADELL